MSVRTVHEIALFIVLVLVVMPATHADIFRWDTDDVIPGTEGIEPGPRVRLESMDLEYANLSGANLLAASFESSNLTAAWLDEATLTRVNLVRTNLTGADLFSSTLTNANLAAANLTDAYLYLSTLTDANLTNAIVTGASFGATTWSGFTEQQLYSTASYKAKNLQRTDLSDNDLSGWDFSGQDLTDAYLSLSTLANANLTDAIVTGTSFGFTTSSGFTEQQLYSTASYKAKNLQWIDLSDNDLSGWNFSGQDLTNAYFYLSTLANADLTDALVTGASFGDTTAWGFTREQLYSTASYKAKNLQGIDLSDNELGGWDFSGQDLTDGYFSFSTLANADLTDAIVTGTSFSSTTSRGFTKERLYSTASYQAKNLRRIDLSNNDLVGWDFSGQDLTGAALEFVTLTNADLTGANLKNALVDSSTLEFSEMDSSTVYNQWTQFPPDFDPIAAGLTLMPSPVGDFNADDALDAVDLDALAAVIQGFPPYQIPWWLPEALFDVNGDSQVDSEDHRYWIKDLKQTWFGDSNLDGEFNSLDMVQVFQIGKYETGEFTGWGGGDWNADGIFGSGDMVTAFVDGGYELGPANAVAVPEPIGWLLCLAGLTILGYQRRRCLCRLPRT